MLADVCESWYLLSFADATSPQMNIPGGSALQEVSIIFLRVWMYLVKQRSYRVSQWIWTLSRASVWFTLIRAVLHVRCRSDNPNIQSCFSQGSPNSFLCSSTTNHFEVRVTQGWNVTLIYHTWYEIKPEKPKPRENFPGVSFKGVWVPNPQTPYLSSSLQKL